jgi:hypothetical protein
MAESGILSNTPEANRRQLQRHREMLLVACLIIMASFLLEVRPGGTVGFLGIQAFRLPTLCLSQEWFGIQCPGCGLTRSFVYLAHGHWQEAWKAHRLGWLLAITVILQIPYRIHALWVWPKSLITLVARERIGQSLIALLICNWLIQFLPH